MEDACGCLRLEKDLREVLLHTKLSFCLLRGCDPPGSLPPVCLHKPLSQGENVSKAFINCSHDKSCPGENLVCMTTIRINLSLLTICCAQSQLETKVFLYTNQLRAHTGTELCPSHHTSAHVPRGACSAGHSSVLQLPGTKIVVYAQAQGPGGFPGPHSLVPPFTSRLTRARFGIWIWAGAKLTCLDLTLSCSAPPGNQHHLIAAQTCYHELCFTQNHAVTCFKTLKHHKFDSSWANSSRCIHTVPLGSWFPLSECQILQRY